MSNFMTPPSAWIDSKVHARSTSILIHLVSPSNGDHYIYLVIQTKDGKFSIPGGLIDFGEKPFEAVIRELMEESGLSKSDCKYLMENLRVEVKYTVPGENGTVPCRMYHWFFLDSGNVRHILRDRYLPTRLPNGRPTETKYAGLFYFGDILRIARRGSALSYSFDGKDHSSSLRNCQRKIFTKVEYEKLNASSANILSLLPTRGSKFARPAPVPATAPSQLACRTCTFLNPAFAGFCSMCGDSL